MSIIKLLSIKNTACYHPYSSQDNITTKRKKPWSNLRQVSRIGLFKAFNNRSQTCGGKNVEADAYDEAGAVLYPSSLEYVGGTLVRT